MQDEKLPKEIERKYLIKPPTAQEIASFPKLDSSEIVQTYLTEGENGMSRRVRKRCREKSGEKFYYTQKSDIGFGERIELEREITQEEYKKLLAEADPKRRPIEKVRHCFEYDGRTFELDIYAFDETFATLEIELNDINEQFNMPDFITVLKDVTGDRRYTNATLAMHNAQCTMHNLVDWDV